MPTTTIHKARKISAGHYVYRGVKIHRTTPTASQRRWGQRNWTSDLVGRSYYVMADTKAELIAKIDASFPRSSESDAA